MTEEKKHIVMFSSGAGSAIAGKRIVDEFGPAGVTLLFCDTMIEDADNYRFLDEAAAWLGVPVTRIADGRTPWEVMRDKKIIANNRIDPCSHILKRQLADKWIQKNAAPDAITVIGIDWTEQHRFERFAARHLPRQSRAPLCEPPYLNKKQMLEQIRAAGIAPPRLYSQGHSHANCGGFCVRAGQAQFALLLRTNRELYLFHEGKEEEMRELVGNHSMMSDRRGDGKKKTLTMRDFRKRLENQPDLFDKHDIGGCGCAID